MRMIRDCNVVVVGGAGFLGSHLTDHLIQDRGCRVLVVDNLVAGRREFVNPKAEFLHHDICGSEAFLRAKFEEFSGKGTRSAKPLFVFVYAAYPYVPDSFARPIHVADVNFMGALRVINAAHEAGAAAILQVSSAEIYGSVNDDRVHLGAPVSGGIMEDYPVNPHSSYGASKAAVDAAVQVRWRKAKVPCIALRQFNCVGERETHPYVVPEIISQLSRQIQPYKDLDDKILNAFERSGATIVERGGLHNIHGTVQLGNNSFRDFLYAGDAVRIAVELLERGQFGEVYNLDSESGLKMYDLAKLIGKLMGFADVRVERDESRVRPWEIWHLQSCNGKLNSLIPKFGPTNLGVMTSLEESLRRTIRWFEEQGRKWPWEK